MIRPSLALHWKRPGYRARPELAIEKAWLHCANSRYPDIFLWEDFTRGRSAPIKISQPKIAGTSFWEGFTGDRNSSAIKPSHMTPRSNIMLEIFMSVNLSFNKSRKIFPRKIYIFHLEKSCAAYNTHKIFPRVMYSRLCPRKSFPRVTRG